MYVVCVEFSVFNTFRLCSIIFECMMSPIIGGVVKLVYFCFIPKLPKAGSIRRFAKISYSE